MQQGTITNLHIARVKETPSDPVQEATAHRRHGAGGRPQLPAGATCARC